eukprot:SAG31_NODE_1631_length_7698_cov_2.501908_6_plen_146_part_00
MAEGPSPYAREIQRWLLEQGHQITEREGQRVLQCFESISTPALWQVTNVLSECNRCFFANLFPCNQIALRTQPHYQDKMDELVQQGVVKLTPSPPPRGEDVIAELKEFPVELLLEFIAVFPVELPLEFIAVFPVELLLEFIAVFC